MRILALMTKPNTVPAAIISAFALASLFLFAAVIHVEAGAPIRNGDVKLGKSPGGGVAARTKTDSSGHFSFPVQPAGSYTITVSSTEPAEVTVHGVIGGTITKSSSETQSNAKTAPAPLKVDVKSDGKTPISGTTVRKGHSNAVNN
jgi:hypothetical protein